MDELWPRIKKRWRAWLRAVHRDFGYLAIGFTVIYAISGIAQNHIEDWGEVSYKTYEQTIHIAAIPDDAPDDVAIKTVADAAKLGTPTATFRAGDEVRLEYANGAKVTAIGSDVTIQGRERRAFIGAANWLHTARNRKGWRYVADVYATLLLYLAISGIFMIKGRLGLQWRGALLISIGVAVPVTAVLMSGPDARAKVPSAESAPATAKAKDDGGIKFLPADEAP
ncbi:MAG TPA: PepSY-associated TM helix domain-containing protein [Kofleriaceae bacterium]